MKPSKKLSPAKGFNSLSLVAASLARLFQTICLGDAAVQAMSAVIGGDPTPGMRPTR